MEHNPNFQHCSDVKNICEQQSGYRRFFESMLQIDALVHVYWMTRNRVQRIPLPFCHFLNAINSTLKNLGFLGSASILEYWKLAGIYCDCLVGLILTYWVLSKYYFLKYYRDLKASNLYMEFHFIIIYEIVYFDLFIYTLSLSYCHLIYAIGDLNPLITFLLKLYVINIFV